MRIYTRFYWKNYFENNGASFVIFRVRLVRQMGPTINISKVSLS